MRLPDLTQMPWWYILIAAVFSFYYGWRGYMGTWAVTKFNKDANNSNNDTTPQDTKTQQKNMLNNLSKKQIIGVYCVQQFISHFLSSLSGFLALYILSQNKEIKGTDDSIFIIFLSLYSIAGVTDILPELLPQGKFPGK